MYLNLKHFSTCVSGKFQCIGDSCTHNCTSDEFQCESDGWCIQESYYCDGTMDCFDGSDEAYCGE